MLRAKIVNENTIDEITTLNSGVRPHEECVENKTYFTYSDDPDVFNNLMTDEEFHATYRFTDTDDNENTIERI